MRFDAVVIVGLISGITPKGQTHDQSMRYLVESLKECVSLATLQGVRLAIESLNHYETDLIHAVDDGLKLLELIRANNLGLLLDTFHMNIEEPVIEEGIRRGNERIFHFHVADSNRWYPGAGHLDFKSILNALSATGYRGFISGEFLPKPDADTSIKQNILYLRQLETPSRPFTGNIEKATIKK